MRDNFSAEVKRIVAHRVGLRCSRPECRASTSGPTSNDSKALNIGVAAHISAASPGGPRFESKMSAEQRRHASNAIWLCQNCAKLVDNDEELFTSSLLQRWKRGAEAEAHLAIGKTASSRGSNADNLTAEEIDILCAAAQKGEIQVIEVDELSPWLLINGERICDESDPAFAAMYLEALKSLIARRLVEPKGGILYGLTGTGFKIAQDLETALAEYHDEDDDEVIYPSTANLALDEHFPVEFTVAEGEGISYRIDSDYPIDVMIMSSDDYRDWRNSTDGDDPFVYMEYQDQCLVEEEFWPEVALRYVFVISNEGERKTKVSTQIVRLFSNS